MDKGQTFTATATPEDLKKWEPVVRESVEKIEVEYLLDRNNPNAKNGLSFLGANIKFKDGITKEEREKIQKLVEATLSNTSERKNVMEKEQILVVNTVQENLKHWDESITSQVESINGEYLYDANQKVPGGVDFVGVDIQFKDGVTDESREMVEELVEAILAENISESTERAVYRGGVVVDRDTFADEESKQERRESVLDHQRGNPMATTIDLMRNLNFYESVPKIASGEVISKIDGPEIHEVIVGVRSGDKTYGIVHTDGVAEHVKMGESVEIWRDRDGVCCMRSLEEDMDRKKGVER